MGYVIIILVCNLLVPLIMLCFGLRFRKQGPKNINMIYGYRTSRSMKNKDTWEFAHKYCGKLWVKVSLIMMILSVAVSLPIFSLNDAGQGILEMIIVTIQTVVLIASIFPVEKALKKNFDDNGNKIEE